MPIRSMAARVAAAWLLVLVGASPVLGIGPAMDQALALIDAEQYQAAIGVLKQIDPASEAETAQIERALGRIYLGLGKPAKAADFFEQALTTSLDSEAESYLGLAEAKLALGNLAQARRHAETVLRTDPDQVGAHLVLARLDQRLGREAEALRRLDQLARDRADSEEVALVLARYLARAKSPAAAAESLAAFLRRHPDAPDAADLLGILYWEMGRKAEAVRSRILAGEIYLQRQRQGRAAAIVTWLEIVDPDGRLRAGASQPEPLLPPVAAPEPPRDLAPPPIPPVMETRVTPPSARPPGFTTLATPEPLPFRAGSRIMTGSGIVLEGGRMVITNRHVVENTHDTAIRNGTGHVRRARVVRISSEDDLALLELSEPFPEGEAMPLAGISDPAPGRAAIVMGFPLIMILGDEQPALTEGIVSKTVGLNSEPTSFQMTTKINKGNSGGPVFDRSGRLIGIAVAKLDTANLREKSGIVAEDVNFAIKASRVLRFLGKSESGGGRPAAGEVPLEDLYQSMLPRVVLIASAL